MGLKDFWVANTAYLHLAWATLLGGGALSRVGVCALCRVPATACFCVLSYGVVEGSTTPYLSTLGRRVLCVGRPHFIFHSCKTKKLSGHCDRSSVES